MDDVILEDEGMRAVFSPSRGMNLISLCFGSLEVIDQSTKNLFDERSAGLGALIGPHFHRRAKVIIPKLDTAVFPRITKSEDPFSHGVARYAPWNYTADKKSVRATLKGSDVWEGVKLSDIEGQDFTMIYSASVEKQGLELSLSVVSQADSLVGIHFYYRVPEGKAYVESVVDDRYINKGILEPIPSELGYEKESRKLTFSLDQEADFTFHPFPNPLRGEIGLKTSEYTLNTIYESDSSENSWQLWRPKGSFVCIEPISSWDPRHPNLTVSSIRIRLELSEKT